MILYDFILISFKMIKKIIIGIFYLLNIIILMKRFNNFNFNRMILITDSISSYFYSILNTSLKIDQIIMKLIMNNIFI